MAAEVPIVDANRRPVGGKLQIKLRVRTPLVEKQYRKVTSSKLVVGAYPPIVEEPSGQDPLPSVAKEAPPPPPTTAPLKRSLSTQLKAADDPHSVELIVSYDVMTGELETVVNALQSCQISEERETLELRQQALELKKQMLEIEMQSGTLTLPIYLDRLRAKIQEDRSLAVLLSKQGRQNSPSVPQNKTS